ncbi:MAG TPA: YbhB/YbcL family Raf kinase inhibitor-like protein [Candidatus Lokiarchaeia archaeon]
MKLTSNDFKHNQLMDKKFSYRTQNVSPHLKWEDIPAGTKSFALLCNDPDGGDWIHWFIINIPANIKEIPQGGPVPGEELENDFRKAGYGGPSPPSGTHRYFFRVYALKTENLKDVNKSSFNKKVKENAIATAEIIGLFKK